VNASALEKIGGKRQSEQTPVTILASNNADKNGETLAAFYEQNGLSEIRRQLLDDIHYGRLSPNDLPRLISEEKMISAIDTPPANTNDYSTIVGMDIFEEKRDA